MKPTISMTPENTARDKSSPRPLQGSTLISLVVAIMVFSVLAAAIVPMISSSSHQTGAANMSAKAYLLAESGFRYAASTYLHAGNTESIKNDSLEELDGNYTLSDGNSRFELKLFSYFYEVVSDISSGDTSFKAHTPGTFPDGALVDGDVFLDPGLEIQIEDQFYTLTSDSQPVAGEDDNATIAVTTALPFYPAGTLAYPVATAVTPTVSNGDDLVYQNGHGRMFPLRNGRIRVNGRLLTYGYNDRANNRFVDVHDPQDADMEDYPVGTRITLTKFVRLQSTGIYGSGSMQARRQVTYHTPLPIPETVTQQEAFTDRFDAKEDWTDTAGTTTSIGTVHGNSALQVDSTVSSGSDQGSLTAFNPTTSAAQEIDFNASRRGSRGFLSYDIQAKFGFDNTPEPSQDFEPPTSSIPRYFAAGLSFRLRNADSGLFSSNGYGVSFLRGNRSNPADGIPDDFVPIDDQAAIVLWKQTGNGANRTWLAYKQMMDLIFNEDNEDSIDDQFSEIPGFLNLWDAEGASGRQRSGSIRNWYYGRSSTTDYDTGAFPNTGIIQSDLITLAPGYSKITLKFYGWHETEPARPGFDLNDFDRKEVIIVDDNGLTLSGPYIIGTLEGGDEPPGEWYQKEIDLTGFAGQIRIQFKFDTVDELNNNLEGWYIDDVQIVCDWPIQNSTLAVNLQEAMVVRFTNGTPEIRQGDRLHGHLHGTIGTVMAPPLLTGGDWSGSSPAEGTLFLNRTAVTAPVEAFSAGEQLTVVGGTGRAEVAAFDQNEDPKANIIRVHFASEDGIGTANTNPVDVNSLSYGRLGPSDTLRWPPNVDGDGNWTDDDGNFTAADDFFRLVQWDAVNSTVDAIDFRTNDQGLILNAAIQDHDDTLQSPVFPGILTEAEIGLHAVGDGALNAYFDDFGIRIQVSSDDTVPLPLQQ
ncbi:MAG: hypothetical protein PVH87_09890 [Desulfobacteraceae bacterium]